ncbi:MAG: KGG domain-containing protein [Candidatus Methylomirabilales bacterium]
MSNGETERPKGSISVQEAGRRGGARLKELYDGTGHWQKIGKKGGSTTFERHGTKHFQQVGEKGGAATLERHGTEFYREIGKKGGQRVRELIAKAKEAEEKANG